MNFSERLFMRSQGAHHRDSPTVPALVMKSPFVSPGESHPQGKRREFVGPDIRGRERKLKIWLPDPVFEALTLVAEEREVSRPDLIRRILYVHLFGRPALEMIDPNYGSYRHLPLYSLPARDPDEPPLPLGKSTNDALVAVSEDIHDGLRRLAERHGQMLGTYVAYVLCWAMFGRGVYLRLALDVTRGLWVGDDLDEPEIRESPL